MDRLVEKLEAHADEILDTYLGAIRGGDWRAAEAPYDRVYGKSKQRHEVETPTQLLPQTTEAMEAELRQLEGEYGQEAAPTTAELPEEGGG